MNTDDVAYWDDDPSDPMPDMTVRIPSIPLLVDGNGDPDKAAMLALVEVEAKRQINHMSAWWRRRIARERRNPSPHPETERIAHNVETDL